MRPGQQVSFKPKKGKARDGVVQRVNNTHEKALVLLEGDPFPVSVKFSQLSCIENGKIVRLPTKVRKYRTSKGEAQQMPPTRTKPSAKELRNDAKALGVEGWEDMGRAELAQAVKEAKGTTRRKSSTKKSATRRSTTSRKKTSTKAKPAAKKRTPRKATSKKAATRKSAATRKTASKRSTTRKKAAPKKTTAKKARPESVVSLPPKGVKKAKDAENPFRKGSNLHVMFPILCPRGGTRRKLAVRLKKKVDLHPYKESPNDIDLKDYDKRLTLAAQSLRDNHGFAVERKGRGLDGTLKVFVPGGENDPRKK